MHGGKRLLLVEDDVLIAAAEKMQLERRGYSVSAAASGEEAVQRAFDRDAAFDAVLMDIDLGPGMDGTRAAEKILEAVDIPIIFLSSHTEPEIVDKTENISSYGYVVKNSGIVVLDASIKMALKLFDEKSERRQAEAQVLRMKSLYAALSQINQTIVRVGDLEELAVGVCRIAVDLGLFKLAWVGRHDGATRRITPLGFAGGPESIVYGIRHSSDEGEESPCLCGPAVRENRSCVFNVLSAAQGISGVQAELENEGIRAAAVFPIRAGASVWGVFGVYAEEAGIFKDKETALLEEAAIDIGYAVENLENQARRREAEKFQSLSTQVLGILNESSTLRETSREILKRIKEELGVDAVGIRLKDGDDYPYFSETGFEKDFVVAESSLLLRDGNGAVCRNPDGSICLECTCGLVLSEKCGPPSGNVTAAGSLWTNDSFETREALRGNDPRLQPRDRCSHDGYLSIALIPIRADRRIIGLLHLNDRRRGRFTPEAIGFLERLTEFFGIAVERKQAETSLRESEERLRAVFEQAAVGVAEIDSATGRFDRFNERFCGILGLGRKELALADFQAALLADSGGGDSAWARELRSGTLSESSVEIRFRRKDGSSAWVALTVAALSPRSGSAARYIAVALDITERKLAEEKLRESEARYRLIAENAADVIWVLDPGAEKFTYVSPSVERLRGYTPEEVMAQPISEALTAESLEQVSLSLSENLPAFIARGKGTASFVNEIDQPRRDGGLVRTEVTTNYLFNPEGKVQIVGVSRDITDRKRAEEEIRRQLKEKDILLLEVHHRIKNNIASIESLLSMQADSTDNEDVKFALQESIARVQCSRVLYENLLISKDHRVVSTKKYMESLIESLRAVFHENRNISVESDIADFPLGSNAMAAVGIVLNELITNIFKYAFKGRDSGRISIALTGADNTLTLSIQDDGIGIEPKPDAGAQQGFGLTLIDMLAKQLRGSFSLESGNGTKAVLKFPA